MSNFLHTRGVVNPSDVVRVLFLGRLSLSLSIHTYSSTSQPASRPASPLEVRGQERGKNRKDG